MQILIKDISNLADISMEIKNALPNGGIVLLIGNLASGKTTLVKNFVNFLGLQDDATSPTFSILNTYSDQVHHYDIYNEGTDKFMQSGLLENLELEGYHFIEWADEKLQKLIETLGFEFIKIEIEPNGDNREYRIKTYA
jgi:tRNA threonylcarbamoyladenosine biosynthesis protein TsaE